MMWCWLGSRGGVEMLGTARPKAATAALVGDEAPAEIGGQ
jgi:hypothetical protein